jgi:hypothetical protein
VFLIRTDQSYFAIDARLQYETTKMHNAPVDVDKSFITKTVLSFSLPQNAPGEKFYPLSTRYSYIWSFILCALAGLALFIYPKYDFSRIYLIVISILIFFCTVIPVFWIQWTINSIYETRTIGW